MFDEGKGFGENFFLQRVVVCHHLGTGLLDEFESLGVCLCRVLDVHLNCTVENQERDGNRLAERVAKRIESAHEAEERMKLFLSNVPVLLE